MTVRTSLAMVKLTSIVFVSAAIVFALKYYDTQKQNQKLKETIKLDKETYTNDLKEIFDRYDAELLLNKNLLDSKTTHFTTKAISTQNAIESLDKNAELSSEKAFNKTIDSLKQLLKKQSDENQLLNNQLNTLLNKNSESSKKIAVNEIIPAVSNHLKAVKVSGSGMKTVSNNIVETKRFSNTEQIKVCFTLLENKAALKGNKDVYIQIINPKNRVVSKNGAFVELGDKSLYYSAKTNVFYDNENLDVCVFVGSNKNDVVKGDYELNIFSGTNLIGNTVFSLK